MNDHAASGFADIHITYTFKIYTWANRQIGRRNSCCTYKAKCFVWGL